jgi:hypothetical protein
MGGFLSMSGIVGSSRERVEAAIGDFVTARGGVFVRDAKTLDDRDGAVMAEGTRGWSIIYPFKFFEWDELAKELSGRLDTSVFSFHIHDGDLWMLVLFHKGEQVAQFNPLPEYWDDSISEAERQAWAGDAEKVASYLPDLDVSAISPYFKHWDFDERGGKAFPDDEFEFNDAWQLCDFLRRIGFAYPIDEKGEARGETYKFECPAK